MSVKIGPACDAFEFWQARDSPKAAAFHKSEWISCGNVDRTLLDCPHFAPHNLSTPQNLSIPWSSVIRQGKLLYQEGIYSPSYSTELVEGTILTLGNADYSVSFSQMLFQVQLINFDDDWIGASFRYRDDDNYYRFEMSRAFAVVRLKKSKDGVKTTIWDEKFEYKKGQERSLVCCIQRLLC